MAVLVQRVDDIDRSFARALGGRGDLGLLVAENPLRARSLVEELWNEGLSRRSRSGEEGEGEDQFGRARQLAEAIEREVQDASLVHFTEWYLRRGPAGAQRVLGINGLLSAAEAHYDRGDWSSAGQEARAALDEARSIVDHWNVLRALHLLGDAAWMRGVPLEARRHYEDLYAHARERGSREQEAAAINNLAAIDEDEGRLREAVDGYRRSLELARHHGLPDIKAFALLYLGHLFHHQGLYERAVGYFRQAEEGFRELGEIELEATSASNRGASLHRMRRIDTALAAYRHSLALRGRAGDRLSQQATLLHIAELLAERGEREEALTVLGEILRSTRGATDTESLHVRWGALLTASDLNLSVGRHAAAREAIEEASRIAGQRGRALDRAETWQREARLFLAERDTARAVEALESSVNVIETVRANAASHEERVRFLETRRAVYEELAGVHFQLSDPERAFELLEHSRSRALLDSLQGGVSLAADENGAMEVLLDEAAEPEPMSRLSASLEPGTLVLHYTVTPDWLAVLAIDSKGLRAWRVRDLAEDELSRLALLFGGDATASFALQEGWTQLYSDAQRSLSLLLLAPVAHLLPDASTLIIVPDDVLFSLPWGALRWGDWTRYLSETHAIAVQPSASAYVRLRSRPSRGSARERALVVANPAFNALGASLPALPEAEVEARELARLMPGSHVLLGPEASETAVRREMGQYPIVHFATHGRVDTERPGQSSILLAGEKGILEESALSPLAPEDGVLSGLEVLEISLQPGALITLAACETVRGPQRRGEGVVGLARAFLQSGAGTVVATLWPVEDRATRELMVRFYEELGTGRSAAASLSRAQAAIAQGGAGETRRYPYFWAGFVLIGDDR
jgi:CHAT domain-containing protein